MADPSRRRPDVPVTHSDGVFHRRLLAQRVNVSVPLDGSIEATDGIQLHKTAVADLPAAAQREGQILYVSDETGGAVLAFSDGTNWRRSTDRNIVS